MRIWFIGATLGLAVEAAAPQAARAQTFDVKLPEVKQGSLELGFDNSAQHGLPRRPGVNVNRSAHDQSLDWGVTDRWRLSGVLKLENPEDADVRVGRMAMENLFVLRPVDDKRPLDVGLGFFTSLEASVNADTTNTFVFGPILTLAAQKLSFTVNPFLDRNFGRNAAEGIALAYGWQAKYELREGLAVGVEGFGLIDNLANPPSWSEQDHHVGPAIFTEIALTRDFKITPDVGVLFGLTRATPDVAFKLNIGIPLHQRRRGN